MPETAERPASQDEQGGLSGELPTQDELDRTAEQLLPQSDFDRLMAQEAKKIERLSDEEVDALLTKKIQEHGQIRGKISEVSDQIDALTSKVLPFVANNLRGEGSITPATKDTARRFLSQFTELGAKMSELNQQSEIIHTEAAAGRVAAGRVPNQESLTIKDVLAAVKSADGFDGRLLEKQLRDERIDEAELAIRHPSVLGGPSLLRYGGPSISSIVKLVAKYYVYPSSHQLTDKMSLVNASKLQLEKILQK